MSKDVKVIGTRSAVWSNKYACNIAAGFASQYDVLYLEKTENKVVLWKKARKNAKKVAIHKSKNTYVLSVKGTCIEGKVALVEEDKYAFYLSVATELQRSLLEQRKADNSANVGFGNNFLLDESLKEKLHWNDTYKVAEYSISANGAHIRVYSIPDVIPKECCGTRRVKMQLKKAGKAIAYIAPKGQLKFPTYFIEKSGILPNTTLDTAYVGDSLYIYAKGGDCGICGRKITYNEEIHHVHTCKECRPAAKFVGEIIKQEKYSYRKAYESVKNMQKDDNIFDYMTPIE